MTIQAVQYTGVNPWKFAKFFQGVSIGMGENLEVIDHSGDVILTVPRGDYVIRQGLGRFKVMKREEFESRYKKK